MADVVIRPIALADIEQFRHVTDLVMRERSFLAFVEGFPIDEAASFVARNVRLRNPQFVADDAGRVVGWCDIRRETIPVYAHVFTPTKFGVYTLRVTGVNTTTTTPMVDVPAVMTTTNFTVTAPVASASGAVFPSGSLRLFGTAGFVPGETVSIVPQGGMTVTAVVNSTGGFTATATAPPNIPISPLTVTVTGANGTITVTQPITVPTGMLSATPNSLPLNASTVVSGSNFIPNQSVTLTTVFNANGTMAWMLVAPSSR